jgi:oligopeptidase B
LQGRLYQEMLARIKETDLSVPVKIDDYYYYTRTEEGLQYSIYYRGRDEQGREEEVLLDLNELAAGHPYLGLGAYEVSPDHRLLAYSLDTSGA